MAKKTLEEKVATVLETHSDLEPPTSHRVAKRIIKLVQKETTETEPQEKSKGIVGKIRDATIKPRPDRKVGHGATVMTEQNSMSSEKKNPSVEKSNVEKARKMQDESTQKQIDTLKQTVVGLSQQLKDAKSKKKRK
jgi:hypothetical protein